MQKSIYRYFKNNARRYESYRSPYCNVLKAGTQNAKCHIQILTIFYAKIDKCAQCACKGRHFVLVSQKAVPIGINYKYSNQCCQLVPLFIITHEIMIICWPSFMQLCCSKNIKILYIQYMASNRHYWSITLVFSHFLIVLHLDNVTIYKGIVSLY